MKKQTKVLAAAALFTLGASFSAFAAKKGTWTMADGEWYCYDSNGDVIVETFCLSNGKEYYVGDNGAIVTSSWVEDEGENFYVNSSGQKVKNEWRFLTPYDDEDAEEQWYYFGTKGKITKNTDLTVGGKTYYFNEDGEMLTGWVQKSGSTYVSGYSNDVKSVVTWYCGEDGARLSKEWIYDYAPNVDLDDISNEDEEQWYWIKANGKPATGKQNSINGQTYFFDNHGEMLTGWITQTSSDAGYVEIWEEKDNDNDGYYEDGGLATFAKKNVYFAREDGHAKKNGWIKEYNNVQFGADSVDNTKYWFYINSDGEVYIPDGEKAYAADRYDLDDADAVEFEDAFSKDNYDVDYTWTVTDGNGEEETNNQMMVTEKRFNNNSKTYLFDQHGHMISGLVLVENIVKVSDSEGEETEYEIKNMYYYGGSDDGVRKDGSQSIEDDNGVEAKFYFANKTSEVNGYYNAVGVNGAKNGKLYEAGRLIKAIDDKFAERYVTVTYKSGDNTIVKPNVKFVVSKTGQIQSTAKKYYDDEDVVANTEGKTLYDDSVDALKNGVEK